MAKVLFLALLLISARPTAAEETHASHAPPERLGRVHFPTSCASALAPAFDRAVALLHSFAYAAADQAFAEVSARDPTCAMAHWGRAMSGFHQLWDPPAGDELAAGSAEIGKAQALLARTARERALIAALSAYYADAGAAGSKLRALRYAEAMGAAAREDPDDDEVQVFFALSLLASASPGDRSHARQKQAADILEPIWARTPDHPGAPHYLIHAYDSAELARRGLSAARAYAKIAPSAPHALHMPSHIFTRLGLWDDSIASNLAARAAARAQGDVGEALHASDYLVYAYIQTGRLAAAAAAAPRPDSLLALPLGDFKIGYAASAMPVRLAVESGDWAAAGRLAVLDGSTPKVAAIVWWARALGQARGKPAGDAEGDLEHLRECREALVNAKDGYWASETDALLKSAEGWRAAAAGDLASAVADLTAAADEEDGLEKLPVTPGPIVPAREQLGELYLQIGRPKDALDAFAAALALAPGRRGALLGAAEAKRRLQADQGAAASEAGGSAHDRSRTDNGARDL